MKSRTDIKLSHSNESSVATSVKNMTQINFLRKRETKKRTAVKISSYSPLQYFYLIYYLLIF